MTAILLGGCSRQPDPDQVTLATNGTGPAVYVLVAPIKGKPFADGAQFLMDNIVKSQTGGDIATIKVDPATVQVLYSQMDYGEEDFAIIGKAHITLAHGQGDFDASFLNEFHGAMENDRLMPNCTPMDPSPDDTAYIQGASAWIKQYNERATGNYWGASTQAYGDLCNQLSLSKLVSEITDRGSVQMKSLDEWRRANAYAWTKWYARYLVDSKAAQTQ